MTLRRTVVATREAIMLTRFLPSNASAAILALTSKVARSSVMMTLARSVITSAAREAKAKARARIKAKDVPIILAMFTLHLLLQSLHRCHTLLHTSVPLLSLNRL